jgi:hypothetical protein
MRAFHDPEAKTGHGNGRFSRGYKRHALTESTGKVRGFHLTAMNGGEPRVARRHLAPHVPAGAEVLADGSDDAAPLYTAIDPQGATLLTPQKKIRRTERAWRTTCPPRRQAMEDWRDRPRQTQQRYDRRGRVELTFSALTIFAGGLAPLPAWVRRLDRDRLWGTAKITLYHARLKLQKQKPESFARNRPWQPG